MARLTRQQTLLIGIGAFIVLVLIAAVAWWLLRDDGEQIVTNDNTAVTNVQTVTVDPVNTALNTNTVTAEDESLELVRVANLFTERFGSYSSSAPFQNITNLKPYMTAAMKQWADQYVVETSPADTDIYTAVDTNVVSTDIISLTDTAAEVRLTARRQETAGTTKADPYYQEIVLSMEASADTWLVDEAVWQERGVLTHIEDAESSATNQTLEDIFSQ